MPDTRRRATLGRIVRPPYLQRWAVLIAVVVTLVVLAVAGIARIAGGGAPATAAEQGTLQSAPVDPAVRTTTAAGGRTVALTFDDGPDPVITPQVLDLLARHDARATFCVVTRNAMEHWRLVRRAVAEGHRLCDHTSAHDAALGTASPQEIGRALRISRTELSAAAGDPDAPVTLFRAPEGAWSPALTEGAAAAGMAPLGWSVDPRDWAGAPAASIVATVQRDLRDGGVILLHDGGGTRTGTVAALGVLLGWLREQGYRVVLPDAPAEPGRAGAPAPGDAG